MQSSVERWLPIFGWEGLYEVSSQGRVRSLDRVVAYKNGATRAWPSRILKPSQRGGYLRVQLSRPGNLVDRSVHDLVAGAFLGPRPEGLIVLHGKGGRHDNSVANLSYGTHAKNNGEDRIRDGTDLRGERNHRSTLTPEVVLYARAERAKGRSVRAIARELGRPYNSLWRAVAGHNWGWLSGPQG